MLVEVLGVDDDLSAAGLGVPERDVGVAQERVERRAVLRVAGEAGARVEVELDAADHHRRGERREHALAARDAALDPGDAAEHERELVAAEARGDVARAGHLGQAAGDLDQHEVAAPVAERLVDLLEAGQPDHQHADLLAVALGAVQRALEHAGDVLAVGEPGDPVVARLVLVDHRLATAELDRHERDPDQRDQPQAVVGGDEDPGHERDEHDRPPGVQQQVAAHHQPRADAARERRRRAGEHGVDDQEDRGGGDERRQVLELEVLQAVLVGQIAREGDQQPAGERPADRVLRDVEDEPLERAPAERLGEAERERVHEHDRRDAVGEQQRERERGRERDLPVAVGDLDREQLCDEDRRREQEQQPVGLLDDLGGAADREHDQEREADSGYGRYERAVGRRGHVVKDLTTSSGRSARGRARGAGSLTSSPPPRESPTLTKGIHP